MLAEHFAHGMTRARLSAVCRFSRKATQLLLDYPWPGNVRELKTWWSAASTARATPVAAGRAGAQPVRFPWRPGPRRRSRPLPLEQTPTVARTPALPLDLKQAVAGYEINLLKQALQQSQYNQRKAAQLLALSYHQFRGMLRKYQLLDSDNDAD